MCVSLLALYQSNTHNTHIRKAFHGSYYNGRITKRTFEGLSSDAKPRYHVLYEDDDEEELYVEEIVPWLQVCVCVSGVFFSK